MAFEERDVKKPQTFLTVRKAVRREGPVSNFARKIKENPPRTQKGRKLMPAAGAEGKSRGKRERNKEKKKPGKEVGNATLHPWEKKFLPSIVTRPRRIQKPEGAAQKGRTTQVS